jgi:hypothetical protein
MVLIGLEDINFLFSFYCQMVTQNSTKPSGRNAEEDNQGRNTTGSGSEKKSKDNKKKETEL